MAEPESTDTHPPPELDSSSSTSSSSLTLTVHHHGSPHTFTLPPSSTLADLSTAITTTLSIPPSNQKILISPKPGMKKPPFDNTILLSSLLSFNKPPKITLYGSTPTEIHSLNTSISSAQDRQRRRETARSRPTPKPSTKPTTNNPYTFHRLLPLPHLPNPSRSLTFLKRLASDPGILSTMKTHHFSVPLLTEMDPAAHTTSNSRTLGLNRNKGEVIELRLRTDAYDGYRDYRTIRKTLCHELAHCVFGEHDADFWALTRQIEGEVERGDYWGAGGGKGRSVGGEEFYNPEDWDRSVAGGEEGVVDDHGGWTGGEFVLGGGQGVGGLSRREILAKAAEERMKRGGGEEGSASGEKS
ncbi:hypothetical protein FQN54_008993 [Arachnomyces sp. PD_36]|nr:hypothetical protein FQN54_008993 [Arachnomyces sp. PD_36]